MRFIISLIAAAMLVGCAHSAPQSTSAQQSDVVRGVDLREIIENKIRENVRESFGELSGQNFSDADLKHFKQDNVTQDIVKALRTNSNFAAAVAKVRAMPPDDREIYLKKCRKWLRPTWSEQGEISAKGTTEAGRLAELAISNSIVDLAEELLQSPAKGSAK